MGRHSYVSFHRHPGKTALVDDLFEARKIHLHGGYTGAFVLWSGHTPLAAVALAPSPEHRQIELSVVVAKSNERKGYARALLEAALQNIANKAFRWGLVSIKDGRAVVHVFAEVVNPHMGPLLSGFGFVETGTHRWRRDLPVSTMP